MTFAEAVALTRSHLETKFPKRCGCGRVYPTLAAYVRDTQHVGAPISHDAELGDFAPADPLGTFALANCACGSTLSVSTDGMSPATLHALMAWARDELTSRGITMRELLVLVRTAIDGAVLAGQ